MDKEKLEAMRNKPEFARIPAVVEAIDRAIAEGSSYQETLARVTATLLTIGEREGINLNNRITEV